MAGVWCGADKFSRIRCWPKCSTPTDTISCNYLDLAIRIGRVVHAISYPTRQTRGRRQNSSGVGASCGQGVAASATASHAHGGAVAMDAPADWRRRRRGPFDGGGLVESWCARKALKPFCSGKKDKGRPESSVRKFRPPCMPGWPLGAGAERAICNCGCTKSTGSKWA